jgi:hypothetical protein
MGFASAFALGAPRYGGLEPSVARGASKGGSLYPSYKLLQRSNDAEMADRPPRRDGLGGGDDGVGVDAVVAVEVLD